jgi:tellurite resistance protein
MAGTITLHQGLVYVMVTMSGVDGRIRDRELERIGSIVDGVPVFDGFARESLARVVQECAEILQQESGGLQAVLGLVREAVPEDLRETAYALAAEVAAADLVVAREELRFLSMLRDALGLSKLVTAALERGVIARHRTPAASQ